MKRAKVGIWGPSGSGKTTFLISLYLELVKPESDWNVILPKKQEEREFIKDTAKLIENGLFPQATDIGTSFSLGFKYKKKGIRHRYKHYEMRLIDAAGLLIDDSNDEINELDKKSYREYLESCNGIIMIVDPDASYRNSNTVEAAKTYYDILEEFYEFMPKTRFEDENTEFILPNLAFCITKIDLPQYWSFKQKPTELLRQTIGGMGYNLITSNSHPDRFKVFGVSAVGQYSTPNGLARSNSLQTTDGMKIAKLERQPHSIVDPILWLFSRLDDETLSFWQKILRDPPYGLNQA